MDGVLVDTEELHFESWAQVISDYNIPFDRASFRKTFGMNNAATVMALWPTTPEPGQIAEVSARKEVIFRQILRGRVQPLPGVLEWLERFQRWGLRQAVASSAPAANIDVMLDELGIRTFFMALAPGDSLPSKPDPAVFLEAARLLELAPDRCIVIEDSVAGVSAAHRAGMRCIAVATTHAPAALHNADLVIERLSALPPEHFLRWLSLD
jgi:beta-phosphoglucomutase